MADSVQVVGLQEVQDLLKTTPARLFDAAKETVRDSVNRVHGKVSDRVRDGANGSLHSRTGQLRRSLRTDVYGTDLKSLGGEIYSDKGVASYARIHEEGGTVNAKNAYRNLSGGPYLNIPADANKTAAGVQRLSARDVFAQGGYIVPIRSLKARYAVMLEGVPMFWLVKSVQIPARLQLFKTATDEVPTLLSNLASLTQQELEK